MDNFAIKPTARECIACKVGAIPPPRGDLGFLFLSGVATGSNTDPRVKQHFLDSLCRSHREAWQTIQNLDDGILHFFGII